jgi:hypothetical protein
MATVWVNRPLAKVSCATEFAEKKKRVMSLFSKVSVRSLGGQCQGEKL